MGRIPRPRRAACDRLATMTPDSLTFVPRRPPRWRFWRGVVLGFLSGCVVSYAVVRDTPQTRVHQIDAAPEYVVASALA
jgi:hypothetical protein